MTSLGALSSLERVEGLLSIGLGATGLESLNGLDSLRDVGGGFLIHGPDITSLDGLAALENVGETLAIATPVLVNIDALSALTTVGDRLSLGYSDGNTLPIESVAGLSSLASVGALWVAGTDKLMDLDGLDKLQTIDDDLRLGHNLALTSLAGLDGLGSVGNAIVIKGNVSLPTCQAEAFIAALQPPSHFVAGNAQDSCWDVSGCDPMDGMGVGACEALVGYFWDGANCQSESGCSCVGQDCVAQLLDQQECEGLFAACP